MYILRLSNITKKYKIDNDKQKVVLSSISLMFPSTGLISIVGKSGSGKSTILNISSLLDEPTNGCVYFMNENIHKWKAKRKEQYRNEDIGMIFQSYNLLENQTVLFNIILPALISGKRKSEAEERAIALLKEIGFKEHLYNQPVKDLSGGEKERVAILRALINNPKIIFADEPTGALDSANSILFMELLKKISEERLVILVSHNQSLVEKYSDRIIYLKDGHIESDNEKKLTDKSIEYKPLLNKKKKDGWIKTLSFSNFKRRFVRNIFSMVSLVIGLVSSMLIIGFSNGSHSSIEKSSYKQFDYGVSSLTKETIQDIPGSKMTLVQMSRPSSEELLSLSNNIKDFYLEPNTDALLPTYPSIKCGEKVVEELSYNPVYSFDREAVDSSLLFKGRIPEIDNPFEVVINKKGYEYLKKETGYESLGLELSIHSEYEHHYYLEDRVITDYFIFDKNIQIVGVVDDFTFLSTPKIYYSFLSFKEYLENSLLVNLSEYEQRDITWYERLFECGNRDQLSSYSYKLFLKNYSNRNNVSAYAKNIDKPFKIDCNSLTITETLFQLIDAATIGMELFLVIALLGTALILGIISFSSYSEDKKISAILTCLGANKKSIFQIYFYENLIIAGISLLISFLSAPLLGFLANYIINNITSFSNMLVIPYLSFLGVPLLLPLIIIVSVFLICLLSTYIPLSFSKKISPKEELSEE